MKIPFQVDTHGFVDLADMSSIVISSETSLTFMHKTGNTIKFNLSSSAALIEIFNDISEVLFDYAENADEILH